MSRQTYTFKLNTERIRINLVGAMENGNGQTMSFADYVLKEVIPGHERSNRTYRANVYPVVDAKRIIDTLKDVQNLAKAIDLGIVFDWLWRDSSAEGDEFDSILNYYGFEQIYEIGERDKCWVYGNQMSEYKYFNDLDDGSDRYDGYYLYPNDHYKGYLAYLVMLLSKICLDKEYKGQDVNYSAGELSYLSDYETDDLLEQQTDQALKEIRSEREEEDIAEQNEHYTVRSELGHYDVADIMFDQIKEVQKLIQDYDGKIFIFASY